MPISPTTFQLPSQSRPPVANPDQSSGNEAVSDLVDRLPTDAFSRFTLPADFQWMGLDRESLILASQGNPAGREGCNRLSIENQGHFFNLIQTPPNERRISQLFDANVLNNTLDIVQIGDPSSEMYVLAAAKDELPTWLANESARNLLLANVRWAADQANVAAPSVQYISVYKKTDSFPESNDLKIGNGKFLLLRAVEPAWVDEILSDAYLLAWLLQGDTPPAGAPFADHINHRFSCPAKSGVFFRHQDYSFANFDRTAQFLDLLEDARSLEGATFFGAQISVAGSELGLRVTEKRYSQAARRGPNASDCDRAVALVKQTLEAKRAVLPKTGEWTYTIQPDQPARAVVVTVPTESSSLELRR